MTITIPGTFNENITFQQGDDKWKEYRERALTDLFWFNSVVLGIGDVFHYLPETHLLLTKFAERRTGIPDIDTAPIQLAMWPRECGKSTAITVGRSIQVACADPNTALLIANEKAETSQDFLASIKRHFETNDVLRALFPEVIPPDFNKTVWSAERATLQRSTGRPEPTFDTIGVGGTKTGKHYDHIVCDDLISREAMENAKAGSWLIMERANRWVNQLDPLLSKGAKPFPTITFIGTHWWNEDTYAYLEKAFSYDDRKRLYRIKARTPSGVDISREVYRTGDIAVIKVSGLEDGVATFPKIWSLERMAKLRERDPVFFSCNILNDPTNEQITTFKADWLRYWENIDARTLTYARDDGTKCYVQRNDLSKLMVVDPAFTASGEGARSAIIILGTDLDHGRYLVLDAIAQRVEPRDLVTDILNTAKNNGVRRIFIESVAQQLAFIQFVQAEARARNIPVIVEEVKPGGRNKDVRIEALSPYFKNGQLLVHRQHLDLLREYQAFRPGSGLKDLLDALAYAIEKAPLAIKGSEDFGRAAQAKQGYSDYLRRRGISPQQPSLSLVRS